jgi:hypothetical protein
MKRIIGSIGWAKGQIVKTEGTSSPASGETAIEVILYRPKALSNSCICLCPKIVARIFG